MKLELGTASQNSFVKYRDNHHKNSEGTSEMLAAGIQAAKDGNRDAARDLFLRVIEAEPENETTWMWLASISEYPEELLVFLQNVLNINPRNERALEWTKATKSLLSKTFVERGIHASHEKQKEFAKQCFLQAIQHDDENETAWSWFSSVADSPEEETAQLQKILSLNPENEIARALLKNLAGEMTQSLLKKANFAAISGERETARQILQEVMRQAPELEDAWILQAYLSDSQPEKIKCFEKILELNPDHPTAQAGLASVQAIMEKQAALKGKFQLPPDLNETAETSNESRDESNVIEAAKETSENRVEVSESPTEPAEEKHLENGAEDSENFDAAAAEMNLSAESFAQPNTEPREDSAAQSAAQINSSDENSIESANFSNEFDAVKNNSPVVSNGVETEHSDDEATKEDSADTASDAAAFQPAKNSYFEELSIPETDDESAANDDDGAAEFEIDADSDEFHTADVYVHELFDVSNHKNSDAAETEKIAEAAPHADSSESAEDIYANGDGVSSDHDYYSSAEEISVAENPASTEEDSVSVVREDEFAQDETRFSQSPEFSATEDQPGYLEEKSEPAAISAAEDKTEEILMLDDENAEDVNDLRENSSGEIFVCPFCYVTNDSQTFVCGSCRAMLSLSDLESLLAYREADAEVLETAVEDLEAERNLRAFDVNELTNLGIAHLNLKNWRKGLSCLQEALQANPNDVVLGSKVNSLAIRLSEIEAQASKAEGAVVKNLTIMIVDDSPTVRKLISGKLEKCGHTVVSAVDGMDALDKINESVPDLILLDIAMPRMDGYQVCKAIRSNEATKNVPVVMISGKDGFFDKVRGRMSGSTGYITKPFGPETLMRTVESYIS